MTQPELAVTSLPALEIDVDVLVVGVRQSDDGPRVLLPEASSLDGLLTALDVSGAVDEVRRVTLDSAKATSIALVGLGSSEPDADALRYAAGAAARQIRGVESVGFALPVESADDAQAVLEGAGLGAYSYSAYRVTTLSADRTPPTRLVVRAPEGADDALETAVARADALVRAVHTVRDLVNMPPSDLYPESFAERAVELASGVPVSVDVLDEDDLADGGFGGILAVGKGSSRGPRLVRLEYSPAGATRHIALVGKGITFDSGGLSLKPAASMVGMKYDMTGAATVLASTIAIAALGLPVRVSTWLCLAENMPSGTATRPNDVIAIRGGRTVEVLNTDAEGRLVLADGLVAASELRPDAIVDVATLTGAASVALGTRYVGTMGDTEFVERLVASASRVGETMWPMPLPSELRAVLNSDVADIANAKPGNTAAGMLLGGVFLREFVGSDESGSRIPWAHLDIAGAANNGGSPYGYTGKGPTGVAVRALVALAEDFSAA